VLSRLKLRGDETLLDAGCGTGRLTAELLGALPHGRVVGIDLSQNMVQAASLHLVPRFGGHIFVLVADLQALPFHRVFDGIFSTAAFHWVLDHDSLFRNLHKALRSGGWLEAQCGGGPNLARLRVRVNALAASLTYAAYLGGFREPWFFSDADTAAERMRRAGFTEIENSIEPALTLLDGREQYRDYLRTFILHRHLERIPDPDLRNQMLSELTARAAEDDPPYSLDYWRLNLHGRAI
jgi:trans-aconitate methyltransferase